MNEHFNNQIDKTITVITRSTKTQPRNRIKTTVVKESISIRNKQGRSNRQLYRINMYSTTSHVDANGHKLDEVIQNRLETICSKIKDSKCVNRKIREVSRETTGRITERERQRTKRL